MVVRKEEEILSGIYLINCLGIWVFRIITSRFEKIGGGEKGSTGYRNTSNY